MADLAAVLRALIGPKGGDPGSVVREGELPGPRQAPRPDPSSVVREGELPSFLYRDLDPTEEFDPSSVVREGELEDEELEP